MSARDGVTDAMLGGVQSNRPNAYRLAILGMVPIAVLLVSLNLGPRLIRLLGLPEGLGVLLAFALAVVGFFVSRAILRREFVDRESA